MSQSFDPSSFKAPFISLEEIRKKADEFRAIYCRDKTLPVDILNIVEFCLKLELLPVQRLKSFADIDALLLGDNKTIVVDEEEFMDDRMQNRIRFSLAHEVGHFVLHRDIYTKFSYSSIDDWIELVQNIPEEQYSFLEMHANEFAGRLLVPKDELEKSVAMLSDKIEKAKNFGIDDESLIRKHIAPLICKKFEVSAEVISIRLEIEKIRML